MPDRILLSAYLWILMAFSSIRQKNNNNKETSEFTNHSKEYDEVEEY